MNQGQKYAAEAFFSFLFDPSQKEFILSGPAGVSKTYWMGYIIDEIMPRYHETCKLIGIDPEYDVVMTATTNKAAEVLEYATGRPTQTIHSFLNLADLREDYSTGKMKLNKDTDMDHP